MPYLSGVDASRKNIRAKGLPYSARFFFNGLQVLCCAEVSSQHVQWHMLNACTLGPDQLSPSTRQRLKECGGHLLCSLPVVSTQFGVLIRLT